MSNLITFTITFIITIIEKLKQNLLHKLLFRPNLRADDFERLQTFATKTCLTETQLVVLSLLISDNCTDYKFIRLLGLNININVIFLFL